MKLGVGWGMEIRDLRRDLAWGKRRARARMWISWQ